MATYTFQSSPYDVTINTSGVYNIDAFGAQGGSINPAAGGFGAETGAMFNLTAGERLRIIVGGMGVGGTNGAGGGGGSFVLASTDSGATYSLLLASGGGGGAGGFADGRGVAGGNAQVVSQGSGSGLGGSGGAGAGGGGGGSGFQTGGGDGGNPAPGRGASSYTSFGANGDFAGPGGYGGGGGGGNNGAGGGGGGYSGGNGGSRLSGSGSGGGGTSFISSQGTTVSGQIGATHTGDGSVTVTLIGVTFAPAPTGSFPSTGKSVTFDGTQNVTAAKGDLLVLTLDPQTFAGGAEQNGNVVLSATNGTSATITNAFLTSDGIPNTFLPQGDFLVGRDGFSITSTKANSILIGLPGSEQINDVVDPSLAAGSHFISGGVGRVDSTDGADTITIGGKGLWSVFANAGNDIVTQDGAATSGFDSASVVNVYGQEGNDSITLTNAANKASIFVSGGAGADTITVVNAGTTTIFGGDDSNDGADRITFNGVTAGTGTAGGTSVIFGNGGDDTITVGSTGTGLDSTSTSTVYGGFGNDQITMKGVKAALSVIGGEGSDTITVSNTGTTFITGGNPSGDQSLDGADSITVNGSGGTIAIFSNLGNDTVNATGLQDSTAIQIYGGKGNDTITESNLTTTGKNTIFIAGGEDGDTIAATGNGGALTIYGGISSADSTDGADSITIGTGSTGTLNVFANGGNDTVTIGTLGADSTTTATVYGGGGADSITIAAQTATSQALTVSGNEGADTFAITKGAGQTITIADFTLGTNGDSLKLTGLGGTPGGLQVTGGSYQTLQQALDAAANTANGTAGASKAAAVAFAGSTYVVIDNTAGAGFQATDQAIKLTGVTDLVGIVGVTTFSN